MKVFLNPPMGFGRQKQMDMAGNNFGSIVQLFSGGYYDDTAESMISKWTIRDTQIVFSHNLAGNDSIEAKMRL